jgi:hypothetical protein
MAFSRPATLTLVVTTALGLGLAGPTAAVADCGWVLWNVSTHVNHETVAVSRQTWDVSSGHLTESACRTEVQRDLQMWTELARMPTPPNSSSRETITIGENTVLITTIDGGEASLRAHRYVCLPGSIDPRR